MVTDQYNPPKYAFVFVSTVMIFVIPPFNAAFFTLASPEAKRPSIAEQVEVPVLLPTVGAATLFHEGTVTSLAKRPAGIC